MEGMKEFPDKYFDLAIVDPPYGGGCSQSVQVERERERTHCKAEAQTLKNESVPVLADGLTSITSGPKIGGFFSGPEIEAERRGGQWAGKYEKGTLNCQHWDVAPPPEYFRELARVSKNQIIWGGNYFDLPPTRCFLVWRKTTISENFSMAMAEYAWTSFNENAKVFERAPQDPARFHPTQKPVELYMWTLNLFAKPGDKILDTHAGSASSLVACHRLGFQYVGFEIEPAYFEKARDRLEREQAQISLFD